MPISPDIIAMIVKFIKNVFKPKDIRVSKAETTEGIVDYVIFIYFDSIPDSYIKNPDFHDLKIHKEIMLKREIRKSIQDYLGIKTTGLQPPLFFSPAEDHDLTIIVSSEKR